ncbi:MAG: hypothetical protein HY659_11385 [Rhizobiales bacterium]|nr:hypothetical protein [Hyphomicrobiales bacterium]
MKSLTLALAAAAALGLAATFGAATPANAYVIKAPAQAVRGDVVPAHWYRRHHYRHYHRHHHRHCWWFWRHHHRVWVCR